MRNIYLSIASLVLAVAPLSFAQPAKTGEFEITFDERSPMSAKAEVTKRLIDVADAPDYELSKEPFRIYVPQNYDPKTPHGIVYYIGYKDTAATPEQWHPLLDKAHLIFISTVHFAQPDWQRAGLAFDAIANLSKQYNIDKSRVYLLAYPQPPGTLPQRLSLTAPDVFTGTMIIDWYNLILPVKDPGGRGTYPAQVKIPRPVLAKAASRPVVLLVHPSSLQKNMSHLTLRSYQDAGFKQVTRIEITDPTSLHYPEFKTPWFEAALAFVERSGSDTAPVPASQPASALPAAPSPPSTAVPASRAGLSEPQRLLSLSRSYITARSYPAARTRLQELISKYPNDPAAKEAKTLLDQIKDR